MEDEKDQVQDDTLEEEQDIEEQSVETEEEPRPEELVKGLQKGYTQTRQELAEIKRKLEELGQRPEEELTTEPAKEPQTWEEMKADLLETLRQKDEAERKFNERIEQQIDSQLSQLRELGKIKTEDDENALMDYALKHKIPNLLDAQDRLDEIEEAKRMGLKEGLKGKIKSEEGSKIGTSQKATIEESKGVPYEEIHKKDFTDF